MGCEMGAAHASCRAGYHLCNLRDLHAGGYMIARTMGWATSSSHVWSMEEATSAGDASASWSGEAPGASKSGLGLCCADNE
jgi:hypothetical protein